MKARERKRQKMVE